MSLRGDRLVGSSGGGGASLWTALTSFTATPVSATRIDLPSTSGITQRLPVRYTQSGNTRYGIIVSFSPNSFINIAGPALDTGAAIDSLEIGHPSLIQTVRVDVPGTYADGTTDTLIEDDLSRVVYWGEAEAYLCLISMWHVTPDTGTEPVMSVYRGSSEVFTSAAGRLTMNPSQSLENSGATLSADQYVFTNGSKIEISVKTAGGTGDAADLSAIFLFVRDSPQ